MIRLSTALLLVSLVGFSYSQQDFSINVPENQDHGPKFALIKHMRVFQEAIESGNKEVLKLMMPVNKQNEYLLDTLIGNHKSIKMKVKDAVYIKGSDEVVTGMVSYSRGGGEKVAVNIVLEKSNESPSGYKFISVVHHSSRKRNFPTCVLGLFFCYLYLINVLPGSVEDIFTR